MKLTKSYLRHIINEELNSILLEFDAVDDDEGEYDDSLRDEDDPQYASEKKRGDFGPHIGGQVSKTRSGRFDYDKGEDEVYEETLDEDGYDDEVRRYRDRQDDIRGRKPVRYEPEPGDDMSYDRKAGHFTKKGYKKRRGSMEEGDDWIQKADKDIEKRGTKGRCTGDKFGSESCPEGSKEYDLAKTFKKMGRERKKKDHPGKRDY